MNFNSRSSMAAAANLLALFLVVGVVSQCFYSAESKSAVETMGVASVVMPERELRGKGGMSMSAKGMMGKGDCTPIDAPAKGKGKGSPVSNAGLIYVWLPTCRSLTKSPFYFPYFVSRPNSARRLPLFPPLCRLLLPSHLRLLPLLLPLCRRLPRLPRARA
jgi:hypothetical protein